VFRIFLIVISALAHNSHSKALDLQRSQFSFQSTWSATLATLASRLCGYSTRVFFILLYEQVLSNSVKHIFCIGCYLLWYQLSFIHILLVYRWTYLINRCMHVVVIVVLIEFNCLTTRMLNQTLLMPSCFLSVFYMFVKLNVSYGLFIGQLLISFYMFVKLIG
jgi:hypothetical protein